MLFPRSRVPSFPDSSLSLSPRRGGRVCVFRHGCFRVQQLFPCSTAALQINRRRRRRVSAAFFCSALCLQYKKDQRVEQQRFTFFDCKFFSFLPSVLPSCFCFGICFGHYLFFLLLFVLFVCLRQQRGYICFFSSSRLFHFIIPHILLLCFWCCLFSEVWKKLTIACWMVK